MNQGEQTNVRSPSAPNSTLSVIDAIVDKAVDSLKLTACCQPPESPTDNYDCTWRAGGHFFFFAPAQKTRQNPGAVLRLISFLEKVFATYGIVFQGHSYHFVIFITSHGLL